MMSQYLTSAIAAVKDATGHTLELTNTGGGSMYLTAQIGPTRTISVGDHIHDALDPHPIGWSVEVTEHATDEAASYWADSVVLIDTTAPKGGTDFLVSIVTQALSIAARIPGGKDFDPKAEPVRLTLDTGPSPDEYGNVEIFRSDEDEYGGSLAVVRERDCEELTIRVRASLGRQEVQIPAHNLNGLAAAILTG